MESVLFCSKYYPGAVPFGSATRMERVLRWFRKQEIPVHYLHLVHQSSHQAPPPSLAELVNSQHELPLAGEQALRTHPAQWRSLTRHKRNLLRRLVAQPWARWTTRTTIKRLLRQTQATILWIDHTYVAPLADLLPTDGNLLRIVDTHDVLHLRDESFRAGGLPIKRPISPDDERQLLERFDLVVAIQPDEQQILSRLVPENRVVLVGHAEDCRSSPCTSSDLCFVGSRYVVNEDSLLHFVRDAWPAIRASCPETKLQVAGGVSQSPGVVAAAQQDDRIVLRGIVPQVKDIYAGPAVMICPMAVGSGLKIKMVEALAHGKAVVGTPIAAQGLAAGVNSAFQVAERPADFVGPIIRLLRNPQEREHWEQAALRFAREHLAEEPVWREMKARLDQWRSRPRVRRAA